MMRELIAFFYDQAPTWVLPVFLLGVLVAVARYAGPLLHIEINETIKRAPAKRTDNETRGTE